MMYDKITKRDVDKVETRKQKTDSCYGRSIPSTTQSNGVSTERYPITSSIPWLSTPNTNPTSFGMVQQRLPSPQLFQAGAKNQFLSDQTQVCLPRMMDHQVNRRSRHFVPSSRKDEYYWVKRQKNNEAARKSREKRRINDIMLEKKVLQLVQENLQLKRDLLAVKVKYNEIDASQLQEIKKQIEEPLPHLLTHMKDEAGIMGKGNKMKEEDMQFYADKSFVRFPGPKGELEGKGRHAQVISCTTQDTISAMIVKDELSDSMETAPFPARNERKPDDTQCHHPTRPYDLPFLSNGCRVEDQKLALALKLVMSAQSSALPFPPATHKHLQSQNASNGTDPTSDGMSLNTQNEANKISHAMLMALQSELLSSSRNLPNNFGFNGLEHFSPIPRKSAVNTEIRGLTEKDGLYPMEGCRPGPPIVGTRNQEETALALSSLWQHWNERSKTNCTFSFDGGQMGLNESGASGESRLNGASDTSSPCTTGKSNSEQANPLTPDSESNPESSGSVDSYFQSSLRHSDGAKTSSDGRASNDSSGSESGSSLSPYSSSTQEETSELSEEKSHRLPYKLRFKLAASSSASWAVSES